MRGNTHPCNTDIIDGGLSMHQFSLEMMYAYKQKDMAKRIVNRYSKCIKLFSRSPVDGFRDISLAGCHSWLS